MNNLKVFTSEEFGQVRAVEINGKPYFYGVDVATSLDYIRPSKAVSDHCKGVLTQDTIRNNGGYPEKLIPEGDVYRLIVKASEQSTNPYIKEKAERFASWVFDEVLPSIRQNGGYIANQENLSDTEILAKAVLVAQNVIEQKDKLIHDLKPKAEFFDAVASSKTAIPMDQVAKVLDMGIGRTKLFALLREKKVFDRNNIPYQEFVDRGYFRVVEQKYTKPNGDTNINIKTLVYQRGVDYIRKLVA